MLRILRVQGDSMAPEYEEGDFVLIWRGPFLFRFLKPGRVVAFEHGLYGWLIKRVSRVDRAARQVIVQGTHAGSLDSRRLGPIRARALRGVVVAHIPRGRA